jgi:hypothetical protein
MFELLRILFLFIVGSIVCTGLYSPFILSLAFLLHLIHVPKYVALFAGFALFGILAGFYVAYLSIVEYPEGMEMYNIPAVLIGQKIYGYTYQNFSELYPLNPPPIFWVFRQPQILLFTSFIFWSFWGAIAQLLFNKNKKLPLISRDNASFFTIISLLVCLIILVIVVYVIEYVFGYR